MIRALLISSLWIGAAGAQDIVREVRIAIAQKNKVTARINSDWALTQRRRGTEAQRRRRDKECILLRSAATQPEAKCECRFCFDTANIR